MAEQIAEKLNMKLNYIKQENQSEQQAEANRVFEEELEINDFPQQARWRITSKVVFFTLYNLLIKFNFFKSQRKQLIIFVNMLRLA